MLVFWSLCAFAAYGLYSVLNYLVDFTRQAPKPGTEVSAPVLGVPNQQNFKKSSRSPGDAASQLRHVMSAPFRKKKVMSKAEYRVFKWIEEELIIAKKGYRILSQTSLGEILASDDELAFACINSKRVDILVIDPYGDPVLAVEYQGGDHHQGTAAARDAVKKEALRKAGVRFLEVAEDDVGEEIKQKVRKYLSLPAATTGAA